MPTKQTPAAPTASRQSSSASAESLRAEIRTLGALPKPEMELRLRALDLPRLCDLARAAGLPVCADRRRLEARCVHGFARHSENVDLGAGAGPIPAGANGNAASRASSTIQATRKAALARIRALAAEDDALGKTGSHDEPAFRRLIQKTAKLAKELCPPTTVTIHTPPWCVEVARAAAREQGATLEQLYSVLLTGCWDADVFDEGVHNLLRDLHTHVEAGESAAPTRARPSRRSLQARLDLIRAEAEAVVSFGPADRRPRRAEKLRKAVGLAEDILEPIALTLRLPKASVAHARGMAAEAGVTLEQIFGVTAAAKCDLLGDIENVTGYLDDIEGSIMETAVAGAGIA